MTSAFTRARARDLLIVDDDLNQAKIFELLLADLRQGHRCHHASTGAAALRFLTHETPHENAPRPDLIILDLNMPGEDGCHTLQAIKSDPRLRSIPVIMFSASAHEADILGCYNQYANAYVQKPVDLETSLSVVQQIETFWFHTVRLPA